MYKFEEVCELIKLVGSVGVASVELEHAGSRIRIEGPSRTMVVDAQVSTVAPTVVSTPEFTELPTVAEVPVTSVNESDDLQHISSPIVGTFYRAPNPDADPYVKVGDHVEKGQVLCIVEAMKLMNEIESDVEGTVVKVLPEDAQPVEYGEPLFTVQKN